MAKADTHIDDVHVELAESISQSPGSTQIVEHGEGHGQGAQ